jgi:hypothetical protein
MMMRVFPMVILVVLLLKDELIIDWVIDVGLLLIMVVDVGLLEDKLILVVGLLLVGLVIVRLLLVSVYVRLLLVSVYVRLLQDRVVIIRLLQDRMVLSCRCVRIYSLRSHIILYYVTGVYGNRFLQL